MWNSSKILGRGNRTAVATADRFWGVGDHSDSSSEVRQLYCIRVVKVQGRSALPTAQLASPFVPACVHTPLPHCGVQGELPPMLKNSDPLLSQDCWGPVVGGGLSKPPASTKWSCPLPILPGTSGVLWALSIWDTSLPYTTGHRLEKRS